MRDKTKPMFSPEKLAQMKETKRLNKEKKALEQKTYEEQVEELLRRCKDLLIYYKAYLADLNQYRKSPPFHQTLADLLTKSRRNVCIEAFRDSAKSSLVSLAFPCWRLSYPDPKDNYLVLIKQNQGLAEKTLKEIKDAWMSQPAMKLSLKKIIRDTAGTFDIETVNGRMIIEAYGKGAALRGLLHGTMRPTTVIIDDLQSYEDSLSETTQEKDWEWFLSDVKPLGKDVRIFMIGNNLGRRCVMERVMDLASDLNFETMRIPIMENDVSMWPERFPMDWIEMDKDGYRKAGKLGLWYRERMCQSYDDESRDFTQKMFQYYETLPTFKRICTGVDPAISKAERADFTAIVTAGITEKNHIYVLDIVRKKMLPDETINEIFRVQKKWGSTVGIEDVQFQRMLILEVQKQMAIRNSFFPLSSIKAMGQKEARIREILQPRYATGTVWHTNSFGNLESELIEFPTGLHDDILDGLGIAVRMLSPMGGEKGKLSYLYQPSQNKSDLEELFTVTPRNPLRPIYGKR